MGATSGAMSKQRVRMGRPSSVRRVSWVSSGSDWIRLFSSESVSTTSPVPLLSRILRRHAYTRYLTGIYTAFVTFFACFFYGNYMPTAIKSSQMN